MNIWGILNINPTKNKDEIKKAYLNKLSVVHPEDDEEGFKLLRRSYEEALKEADKDEVIDEDNTPIGIWIKKVNEVYDKFSLRINEEAWKNLLNEDVCYGIDTKEDASEKLLEFLMDNFRFPQKIWILLNNYFEWTEQKEELYEKFPYEFIDYVDNRIKYIDVLNYELFENIDDNKNYDQWIESYYKIRRELNERNLDEAKKSLDNIEQLNIFHPSLEVLKIRYFISNNDIENARSISERLIEEYANEPDVMYSMAEVEWIEKNVNEAKLLYEKVLEILPEDYNSICGLADCYLELDELDKAKDLYLNLMRRNSYDDYVRRKIAETNDKLIDQYKESHEEKSLYEKFNIAWCLYENYRYDEILELSKEIDCDEENQSQYFDLMGRTYSSLEEYSKALNYFNMWCEKIDTRNSEERDNNRQLEYIYCEKARILMKLEKYEEAIKICSNCLEINNKNIGSLYIKSYSLNKLKKFEEALKISEEALELDNSNVKFHMNKAESLYELGYHRDALDSLEEAINIYPYNSEAYALEMEIYYEHSEYERILEIYEEVEKQGVVDDKINLYKLKTINSMKKLDESEEIAINILNSIKENDDVCNIADEVYYELSLIYCDRRDYKTALSYINKSFDIDKRKLKFYYCRGYIYKALKEYDKAIKDYDYAIDRAPEDIFSYLRKAEIYRIQNDKEKSITEYKKVLEIDSKHEYVNNEIGEIYEELHEYDKALEYYNKQIEVKKEPYYLINRGLLYKKIDREDEAVKDYEETIKIDPKNPHAYNNIGVIYKYRGEFEKAIQYFIKAIEVMDDDVYVQFYNNIGKSYKNIKEFDNAIKYYDEGICKLENEPSLYYNKAKTLMAMRKYEEAIEVYIEGAKLNDADKEDFYDEIGDAYKALQEYDNAIIWYEKVIKLNPNHSFEYRQIGNAYERRNHYDTAIAYYLKQIKINDNNPLNYICLAGAYKYKKQKIKARIYYKKALKLYMDRNRDSSFDVCEIGRCYMELNKHKEAVFYLNKAIEKPCNNCDFDGCYEAYYILGEMYENEKDYETAYKYYKKAYDIRDNLEEHVEALERMKKILNID